MLQSLRVSSGVACVMGRRNSKFKHPEKSLQHDLTPSFGLENFESFFFYLRIYFHDVKCSSLGSLTQVTNRSWQQFSITCRGVVWRRAKQIYCHFSSSAWHVLVCWRHGHRRETRGCLPGGRHCDFPGLKQRSCPSKHLTASWTPRADCCWCAGACPPSGQWGGTVTFW